MLAHLGAQQVTGVWKTASQMLDMVMRSKVNDRGDDREIEHKEEAPKFLSPYPVYAAHVQDKKKDSTGFKHWKLFMTALIVLSVTRDCTLRV